MNTNQEDKHSMHLASQRCLEDNTDKLAEFVKYTEIKIALDNNLVNTGNIIQEQEKDRSGVASRKEQLRETLMKLTMSVSSSLVSYATVEKKPELLAEAKVTMSDLKREPDTKVKEKAELINRLGDENKVGLADYGLVAADLSALPAAIKSYFNAIPEPKLTTGERKRLTAELVLNQRATDELLKSIDTMVKTKETREPEFFAEYFNARKINHTGKRIRAFEISVKDATTGEPVERAKVSICSSQKDGTELTKSVKFTGPKGIIFIQNLGPGEYSCIVEFGNFEKFVTSFVQNEGVATKLSIELQPALVKSMA